MVRYPSSIPDSSDAELAAFDGICARLAGFDGRLGFEYVDGWLTGLATGPSVPPPAQWLPLMTLDAFERAFGDPEDAARAEHALLARLAVLQRQLDPEALLDDPDSVRLAPSLTEWAEGTAAEGAARLPEPGELWAMGAIDALLAMRPLWPAVTDAEALAQQEMLLEQVDLLVDLSGIDIPGVSDGTADPAEDRATRLRHYWRDHEPSRDDLISAACIALQDQRLFWVDHAPRPEQRRVGATPGRNDPCSCGSGKKYKKCHGAAA